MKIWIETQGERLIGGSAEFLEALPSSTCSSPIAFAVICGLRKMLPDKV